MKTERSLLRIALCVLISAFFAATAIAQSSSPSAAKSSAYDSLLSKVKGGDMAIDFQTLRFSFAEKTASEERTPDAKLHLAMLKFLNEKNFKEAIKIADVIHKVNFVDMTSHIVAAMAYGGLKDAKKSKFHEGVYLGLVNSILKDADGSSPKTAYTVISVAEEYVLLNALELKRGTQEVENADGSTFHVLMAADKTTNEPVKLYFNIDKVALSLNKVPVN